MIVAEFSTAAELRVHYRAIKQRLRAKPAPAKPDPAPAQPMPPPEPPSADEAIALVLESAPALIAKYPEVKVSAIVRASAAKAFRVSSEEMTSHRRSSFIATARMVAMALAVELGASTKETARTFKKDHTCVVNARRRYGAKVAAARSEISQ